MIRVWRIAALALPLGACRADEPQPVPWTSLFDGAALSGWEPSAFGGEGEVLVEDGRIVLEPGEPLTGIRWTGAFPRADYELELVATRLAGTDFFCGLTFPVGDAEATLVLGGWGGALCGLSCLDGQDASENETKSFRSFRSGQPYRVLIEVRAAHVRAWVDGEVIVDVDTGGREVGLRPEVLLSAPLGVASFLTRAALAELRYREL